MPEIKLWCFTLGGERPFYISAKLTEDIDELKVKINEMTPIRDFSPGSVILWRPLHVIPVVPADPLARRIENWFTEPGLSQYAETLTEHHSVAQAFADVLQNQNQTSPPSLSVIVQVRPPNFRGLPPAMHPTPSTRPEFTMRFQSLAEWDRLSNDDLVYNNVRRAGSSQHLTEFQGRLGRRRYIGNDTADIYVAFRDFLRRCSYPIPWDTYFETVPAETDPSELDRVTKLEFNHYISVTGGAELRSLDKYDQNKESQVRALLLEFLGRLETVPNNSCGFGTALPFHLLVETPANKMRYTPRSDFHMCIKNFPHFLLEVNSQPNEADELRMLLQAACISRIGNSLRDPTSRKPIVIMAIYIDKRFRAHQHLLYQPDVGTTKVEYVTEVFDLRTPRHAFALLFQLYNFLSEAKADNDNFHEPEYRLLEAKNSVARKQYPTLTSKRKRRRGETETTTRPSRDPSAGEGAQDSFDNQSVQRELTRAGYTLTQPISEELTLLTPLKPTIRQATSRSGVRVVLKTIVDSNECQLLQFLSGIKAPSNHTIPLLDVIDLSIGKTIIVLPWKAPLDEVLQFRDRPDDVVSLCLRFIEGVAFLHEHRVAHCDLKPGNVAVDTRLESETLPRVFIIDFGLAESVENEETMTEGWCGTPPWIAPEVGSRNGPTRRYSPILADRWACGRMIEHFAMYFPTYEGERKTILRAFAQRLLDINPRARPELNQLQVTHGPTRRKSASQEEPVPKRHASCGE